ncbi:hypothetical protein Corgl_1096 [Coriobacterium glomerans PW2]|uniref:L-fucose isomerase-like protein n=1 Tax=Coriobacterium glomerans (strain ATCC 49209 / DSM 20642 / JCM 10262 / PW2) TaxID=700015 RepID=F2N821_CORGP|nr:hypothetical protein Corgl_1096 [Coriobacterium glomerans PW2]
MTIRALYLPAARLTFDVDLAQRMFEQSRRLLGDLPGIELTAPDTLLSDPAELADFVRGHRSATDAIIFQAITFVDGEFIGTAIDLIDAPVIIWGLREPGIGGRLRLNSLTGVMAAANTLKFNGRTFLHLIGNPDQQRTELDLSRSLAVLGLAWRFKTTTVGVVGTYPSGFFFSDTNNQALHEAFGISTKKYELADWFSEAEQVSEQECAQELRFAREHIVGLEANDDTVGRLARFTTVARRHIEADHLSTIAMRCWPDFFERMHTAPCGIFSQLTEEGFPTTCEADIHGSLSMFALRELTGGAPYLGDIVSIIEEENAIVMWHCGFAPYSLAADSEGARAGLHPNRKIGVAMDFGLKPGGVTLLRISYTPQGYRLIATCGTALDKPNAYTGTSVVVKLRPAVTNFIDQAITEGYEPHFALAYGDVTDQIEQLGQVLHIETTIL